MKKVICVLLLLVMLSSSGYAVERYKLTVHISPEGSGTVIIDPEMPSDGYVDGTLVTLTAMPKKGYKFIRWDSAAFLSDDQKISSVIYVGMGHDGLDGTYAAVFESTGDCGLFSCVKPSGDETDTTRKILGDWLLLGVSCMTLLGMSYLKK